VGLRTACSPFAAASLTTDTDCANVGGATVNAATCRQQEFRVTFSSNRIGVNLSVRIGQAVSMLSGIRSVQRHGFPDLFAAHRLVQHEAFERIELAPPGRAFQHPHRMRVTRFPTLSDS
jgi:hypothetical protein